MPGSSQFSSKVSAGNSSTTLLGANATFTGTAEDVLAFNGIRVFARQSGGPSAVNGLRLQWSHDGITFRTVDQYRVFDSTVRSLIVPIRARFFRIQYQNGTVAQLGFQLQTILISGADNTNFIETESRLLNAGERNGQTFVSGSIANTNANTTLITASGGTRLYLKTLIYSGYNRDADSDGAFSLRDGANVLNKIVFLLPRHTLPGDMPFIHEVLNFGDNPMIFNTSIELFFITNPLGLTRVGITAHGYEEFLI